MAQRIVLMFGNFQKILICSFVSTVLSTIKPASVARGSKLRFLAAKIFKICSFCALSLLTGVFFKYFLLSWFSSATIPFKFIFDKIDVTVLANFQSSIVFWTFCSN